MIVLLGISKLKKNVGDLTQTVFIPFTTRVVSATATGNMVLWDFPISELVQSNGRDAIKILALCPKTGINLLDTVSDRYLVCGGTDGAIRFFDFQVAFISNVFVIIINGGRYYYIVWCCIFTPCYFALF